MNKQMLAAFTILLFALAITGYAYSHWQKTIQIQGTTEIAKLEITIQDCQTQLQITYQDSHTLNLSGTITSQSLLTNITIKNNGTTPATITHSITTNNTSLWETYFTYNQNITDNYELLAENTVIAQQNITLNDAPQTFTIEVTVTYIATFQSWTDTITINYILTYQ